jgi:hypothetical protein
VEGCDLIWLYYPLVINSFALEKLIFPKIGSSGTNIIGLLLMICPLFLLIIFPKTEFGYNDPISIES